MVKDKMKNESDVLKKFAHEIAEKVPSNFYPCFLCRLKH